jgi:hypothetical protein
MHGADGSRRETHDGWALPDALRRRRGSRQEVSLRRR